VKKEKEIPEPFAFLQNPCGGTRGMNPQEEWRRGPESNRRIEDLQSPALPLGYRAILASDEKY
jgi:hypothetical protein